MPRLYLTAKEWSAPLEVTGAHVFLGYRPLILGIVPEPLADGSPELPEEVCLSYATRSFQPEGQWRGFPVDPQSLCHLHLRQVRTCQIESQSLVLYTGVHGEHQLLSRFYRITHQLLRMRQARKAPRRDNIDLPGNLYDQVRIAYATPRSIQIITVGSDGRYNLFPTDLHGAVGMTGYASSLRHGSRTSEQVEASRKIVLARVRAEFAPTAYAMGKNHMRELAELGAGEWAGDRSALYGLPLLQTTMAYRELELRERVDLGIHRIYLWTVRSEHVLDPDAPALAHIHLYYAMWRDRRGLITPYQPI